MFGIYRVKVAGKHLARALCKTASNARLRLRANMLRMSIRGETVFENQPRHMLCQLFLLAATSGRLWRATNWS